MDKAWQIPRRTFLRGLGAGLALPYLDIMETPAQASVAASAPPQRLLCIFQPNGVYPKAWDVKGAGRNFRLSPILQPLADLQDDLVVLSHLDNVGTRGHVQMTSSFLTGVAIDGNRNGVSLDQVIARKIGQETAFPSLQLGTEPPRQGQAGADPISFANTVSWNTPTTRLSPEINPRVAFDRLFRNNVGPAAMQRNEDRQSVLDLVLEDARDLRRRGSRHDQRKLDEYLQSVRAVESQIDRALNPPKKSWEPPTHPGPLSAPAPGLPRQRDEHLRMMIDLMVLAMWTDSTRVGTLMTAHGFSRQNFSFLDGVTSDHHGMSHHKNKKQAVDEYTTVSRWYIEQLAYLLKRMKQIDEGGQSLLESSVVFYGSGMKDGNGHVRTNLPLLVAGQGGGTLQTGRHIVCKEHTPLANLHLSLLHKFGIEADHFNGASTGVISEL
ncbi:Secreted protein containing DUF1552 [Planctomycetales bacterium 10988]|nr:Secreted protein containing DUF1552 [Planctomycetales bacterium 10988]